MHGAFLLRFAESVDPCPAPEQTYDPATQCGPTAKLASTQKTRSYQNRTSGMSVVTGYEDADDEFVTTND